MENKKSPLLVYREKMAEVHTPEEIKSAFDESHYAVCFNYDRGHGGAKHALFAAIWEVNPDVIITEADLCIMAVEPVVWRDQLLLIDKNGNRERQIRSPNSWQNRASFPMNTVSLVKRILRFAFVPST